MFTIAEGGHAEALIAIPTALRLRSEVETRSAPREIVHRFGRCEVRPASREVLVDGVRRHLQPRPFDLLVYLIEHRDRVLSIDELLDTIWAYKEVQINCLASAVARIRCVLGEEAKGEGGIIQTYHRVGYRFVAPLQADLAGAAP
jgi:DNA-binding winged helix-turn-helix (wHTH) protein